jgi:hypothetical protein
LRQEIQGNFRVHVQLGKTMPVCQIEKEFQEARIMWLGQKTIKDQYCTLPPD